MIRTSQTHPIRVDAVPVRDGLLGLTFCPGKHGDSLNGAPWARDLETDLAALKSWGTGLVVTLMERREFELLRVPDLDLRIAAHGMAWAHLPIPDQGVPGPTFSVAWPQVRTELLSRLAAGGRTVLHCRGGLGRTGMIAAMLLIETGAVPDDAIRIVRSVRPRAIETAEQALFVRNWKALWRPCSRPGTPKPKPTKDRTEMAKKTLNEMRADHRRYGHLRQGGDIVADLRNRFPALEVIGPEEAESGKYIAVYITLVPGLVRMRIHLTSSGRNQHSYNLQPVTETLADQRRFVDYMARHHPSIPLKKNGHYAKLPGWVRANVQNDNHAAVAQHVEAALKVFVGASPSGEAQ